MPCYDGRDQVEIMTVYESGIDPYKLEKANDRIAYLEGMLCAILNELERTGDDHRVITEASRKGLVDIVSFWNKHKNNDRTRLAKELHKYSKDEQAILRILLTKE